jgi:hypothetical protein
MSMQTTLSTQMHRPSQERSFVFARPGFWSAVLTAVFSILFVVGFILNAMGLLPPPWEVVIPVGASLLLAPSFIALFWEYGGLSFFPL